MQKAVHVACSETTVMSGLGPLASKTFTLMPYFIEKCMAGLAKNKRKQTFEACQNMLRSCTKKNLSQF